MHRSNFHSRNNLSQFLPHYLLAKHSTDSLVQKITETAAAMDVHSLEIRDVKLAFLRNAATKLLWSWTFFPLTVSTQGFVA